MRHLSGGLTVVRAQFAPNSVQFSSVQFSWGLVGLGWDWFGSRELGLLLEWAFISHGRSSRIHYPTTRGS